MRVFFSMRGVSTRSRALYPAARTLSTLLHSRVAALKVGPERILHCETVTQDLATDPEFPADTDGLALDTILLASADT